MYPVRRPPTVIMGSPATCSAAKALAEDTLLPFENTAQSLTLIIGLFSNLTLRISPRRTLILHATFFLCLPFEPIRIFRPD